MVTSPSAHSTATTAQIAVLRGIDGGRSGGKSPRTATATPTSPPRPARIRDSPSVSAAATDSRITVHTTAAADSASRRLADNAGVGAVLPELPVLPAAAVPVEPPVSGVA